MELVQSGRGAGAITGELNLELHLVRPNGQATHGAWSADAWAAPGAVGSTGRKLPVSNYLSGSFPEADFVLHLDVSEHARLSNTGSHVQSRGEDQSQMPGGGTPARVSQGARW
jgi:hypothetical protein